jgi:D-alanyl-D-alanine carboxypeptidase/D-alanyl-D-alanine-endopeptidase (penicillin-binding protein 4)
VLLHPDRELGQRERLGQIVVAACVKAGEPVGERVARGQEDHRRADAAGTQCLADIAAVGIGKADVQHENPGRVGAEGAYGVGTRGRWSHTASLALKPGADDPAQSIVVFAEPNGQHDTDYCRGHAGDRAAEQASRPPC